MDSFHQAVSGLVNKAPGVQTAKSNDQLMPEMAISAPLLQVLSVPILWDWDVAPNGQLLLKQFNFCDSMPQSRSADHFISGSQSFSDGYSSFLECIDAQKFPLTSLLKQKKLDNILPQQSDTAKQGWARAINNSGQLQWRRVWNVSESPQSWLASVISESNNEPVELVFGDPNLTIISDKERATIPMNNAKTKIIAEAVGRIQVNPDSWFDSSIITIIKNNKNYLTIGAETVFGDQGLINCRVSEFIVALKPVPSIEIDSALTSIAADNIAGVKLGGFAFTNDIPLVTDKLAVVKNVGFSTQNTKGNKIQITGKLPGIGIDNIYIIAVMLESFE
jgi:hypothetical protein